MSIVSFFPVLQRPWRGYDDPGLPVGMYIAQGTQLGDASGGTASVVMNFKEEGDPLGARFYNIEQIEIHHTAAVDRPGAIVLSSFDIISSQGLVDRRIAFQMIADAISDAALLSGGVKLPIFLGRPQLVGIGSDVQASVANVDGQTLFFTLQGYIWEPRSLLEDGGLRRPLDSLYGD